MRYLRRQRRSALLWSGGTIGVALAFAVWLLLFGNQISTPGQERFRFSVVLPDADALTTASRVTMGGYPVGTVRKVSRHGMGALAELDVTDERVLPLASDTRARLRLRTAIGETFVDLQQGRSQRPLRENAVLPVDRSEGLVDVDRVLSTLRGRTREQVRLALQSLDRAVGGQGVPLNALLGNTARTIDQAGALFGVLHRERRPLARLIDGVGRVTAAIGERQAALEEVGTEGHTALRALASRDDALRATLDVLPATLQQVRVGAAQLERTSQRAAPVVESLATAAVDLRPAVSALAPAAREGRGAVRELRGAAPRLAKVSTALERIAPRLASTAPRAKRLLCEANPLLRYLAPYTDDLTATVVGLSSSTNGYDALGHVVRLTPTINDNTLGGLPDGVSEALHTLIHGGLLQKSFALSYNPYPKPGQVGRETATTSKQWIGPDDVRRSGYVFPRVKADC